MALTLPWNLSTLGINLPQSYVRVGWATIRRGPQGYELDLALWVYASQQAAQAGASPVETVQVSLSLNDAQVQSFLNTAIASLYALAKKDSRFAGAQDIP